MRASLSFAIVYEYDSRSLGIEVPVALQAGDTSVEVRAKIDTGSTFSVFRRLVGERLGFDLASGHPEQISTVTGSFAAYGHEVTLIVLDLQITTMVYFAADEHFPRNVLGRQGWLDRVRLGLIDYDSQLYLSAYDDPA